MTEQMMRGWEALMAKTCRPGEGHVFAAMWRLNAYLEQAGDRRRGDAVTTVLAARLGADDYTLLLPAEPV